MVRYRLRLVEPDLTGDRREVRRRRRAMAAGRARTN